jgi:hypothetical protein
MKTLIGKITKDLADARHLERTTGLLTDDTHRIYFLVDADNGAVETREIANSGDVYDAIKQAMLRVMLKKVRDMRQVRGVIVETHATARRVPDELQGTNPENVEREIIETWPKADYVVTIGHDGENVATASRLLPGQELTETDAPDETDDEGDTTQAQGRLAEAVQTLTLGALLAAQLSQEGDDN